MNIIEESPEPIKPPVLNYELKDLVDMDMWNTVVTQDNLLKYTLFIEWIYNTIYFNRIPINNKNIHSMVWLLIAAWNKNNNRIDSDDKYTFENIFDIVSSLTETIKLYGDGSYTYLEDESPEPTKHRIRELKIK